MTPKRGIEGIDNLLAYLQELTDRTITELDGTHFDIPEPLHRIECREAPPGTAAAMYYTPPSADFSRPGRTWYPAKAQTHFPLWTEVTTAYHEGVPGHHLQVGLCMTFQERLTSFQRHLGFYSGHGEGWALYAERLMEELGYLENPDYLLGMLASQAFRAMRVVVDIGLHLAARRSRRLRRTTRARSGTGRSRCRSSAATAGSRDRALRAASSIATAGCPLRRSATRSANACGSTSARNSGPGSARRSI